MAAEITELVEALQISGDHDGSSTSTFPVSSTADSRWRSSAYGKILITDGEVRFQSLQRTLKVIWRKYGIKSVSQCPMGLFLVEFDNVDGLNTVIEEGPWSYNTDFILLQPVIPGQTLSNYNFDYISIWTQVHNVPIDLLVPEIITNLMHGLGRIHPFDPITVSNWKSFARIKVEYQCSFLLKETTRSKLPTGDYLVANLKYEKLQRFCKICCKLGHADLTCPARHKILSLLNSGVTESERDTLLKCLQPKLTDQIMGSGSPFWHSQHYKKTVRPDNVNHTDRPNDDDTTRQHNPNTVPHSQTAPDFNNIQPVHLVPNNIPVNMNTANAYSDSHASCQHMFSSTDVTMLDQSYQPNSLAAASPTLIGTRRSNLKNISLAAVHNDRPTLLGKRNSDLINVPVLPLLTLPSQMSDRKSQQNIKTSSSVKAKKPKLNSSADLLKLQMDTAAHNKGGLGLFWKDTIDLRVITCTQHMILAEITHLDNLWNVAFFYGHPHRQFRHTFWHYHTQLLQHISVPLLCCGDFNDLLQPQDKQGGRLVTNRHTTNLRMFTNRLGLMDMGFHGPAFTWTNRQAARFNIQERLDRAFATAEWTLKYPDTVVHHLPRISSDHSPILINLTPGNRRRKRYFMFENRWTSHRDFQPLITSIWQPCSNNADITFQDKIRQTKKELIKWNSRTFRRNGTRIKSLEQQLSNLQARPVNDQFLAQETILQNQLQSLLNAEDVFWRQRCKQLQNLMGDRNTKYYHAAVINRRRKNQISRLQDSSGQILDIKSVVFQMNSIKSPGHDGLNAQFFKSCWTSIEALPTYFMSTTELPKSVLKRITDIMRNFWWGYSLNNRHLFLKAWKYFELPKQEGGLGIRNLQLMNKALIMKLNWQIQDNPNKWWVQCLLHKYTYVSDFWNVQFKSYNSRLWGSILATRSDMQHGLRRIINNGGSTYLYDHVWIPNSDHPLTPPDLDFAQLFNYSVMPKKITISQLYDYSTNSWQMDIIQQLRLPNLAVQFLLSLDLSTNLAADVWAWDSTVDSKYTVKAGYRLLQQIRLHQQGYISGPHHRWKVLWAQNNIPPKISMFNWRLVSNCLPVRSHLHRFIPQINPECPFCANEEETVQHLFYLCQFSATIWQHLGVSRYITPSHSMIDSMQIWYHVYSNLPTEYNKKLFMIILWSIWLARNAKVFQQKVMSVQSIIASSLAILNSQIATIDVQQFSGIDFIWHKPSIGYLKINVDAAFHDNSAHVGCIVRDSCGIPICVAGKAQRLDSPLNAELYAIAEGIQLTINFGLNNVILESDCYNAVKMLTEDNRSPPWRSMILFRRCKLLMNRCPTLLIQFIRRTANEAAHNIALHRRIHDEDFEERFSEFRFISFVTDVLNSERDL